MHPATEQILKYFEYEHLPPDLKQVSKWVCNLADLVVKEIPEGPELTVGLRKLLEAKDCFVRAKLSGMGIDPDGS